MKINMLFMLRAALLIWTFTSLLIVLRDVRKHKDEINLKRKGAALAFTGFITNFFDTWGIGSFATTQFCFKVAKSSEDETMPGTLNVGDTFPVAVEALLFFGFVEIDPLTLVLMIAAAVVGAYVGASIVCRWNVKIVRIALGCALLALATVMVCKMQGWGPFGGVGEAFSLSGIKLIVGMIGNFFLGALMMIGFGLYIPCTALISILGMSIGAAFPIMMGSCAFLMNASVPKFVKEGKYDWNATLHLAFFGSLGALAAYLLMKYCFDLTTLTYIICVVMLYTSITFFKDAKNDK